MKRINRFFKRDNSPKRNILALLLFVAGLSINIVSFFIIGNDFLNGLRNLIEFILSVVLVFSGLYLVLDWDEILRSMNDGMDFDEEEDDDEYEEEYDDTEDDEENESAEEYYDTEENDEED